MSSSGKPAEKPRKSMVTTRGWSQERSVSDQLRIGAVSLIVVFSG
jgi:hypothetical protein